VSKKYTSVYPQINIKYTHKTDASTYQVKVVVGEEVFKQSHVSLDEAIILLTQMFYKQIEEQS